MNMTQLSSALLVPLEAPAACSARRMPASDAFCTLLHDLRTPLTSIYAQSQLLRRLTRGQADESARLNAGLLRIEEAAHRMERLLAELADLEPFGERAPQPRHPRRTDLVEIAWRIATESTCAERVVLLPFVSEQVGCWDPVALERLVANLLENGLKYSPNGRLVVLTIEQQADEAVLSVRDRGVGIPADEVPLVFERFYRASNVAMGFPGTGLGLAGARAIVEQHGGTITITSELGVGTTVTVRLPLHLEVVQ